MSKKASFTKGQWIAVGRRVEHPNDRIPDICSCMPEDFGQEGRSDDEACANARLIAAAPTMLHALHVAKLSIEQVVEGYKVALSYEKDSGHQDSLAALQEELDVINDAIILATGEQS